MRPARGHGEKDAAVPMFWSMREATKVQVARDEGGSRQGPQPVQCPPQHPRTSWGSCLSHCLFKCPGRRHGLRELPLPLGAGRGLGPRVVAHGSCALAPCPSARPPTPGRPPGVVRQLLQDLAVDLVLQGSVLQRQGEDLVGQLQRRPGLPGGVVAHVPEDGCGRQGERACGRLSQRLWPCPVTPAPGAQRLWEDIHEDLTGHVPQLRVGVDSLQQRLPQRLGAVRPQVAPGPGPGEHGSADGVLLRGPVRDRGCCEGLPALL